MIVQTYTVILTLSVGLISDVTCASFSNVYVDSDVVPMEYYSYGIPYPSIPNPKLSQINSLPAVPGFVTVHPAHAATHGNPNPNVVTYHAPSAPIVIAPKQQEPTGYEYSYVVYDQNTGDHKAQRELSDGSVVHGEYSFLQPDGYIREVQYVADDVSGFKAVVKNFLPVAVEGNKKGTTNKHKEIPPCHEIKSESLKEGSEEISIKHLMKIHENLHKTHSSEEVDDKSKKHTQHSTPKENNNHSKPKESQEEESSKEKHHLKPKHSNRESDEKSKKHTQHNTSKENNNHSKPKESQEEESSKEKHQLKPKHSNGESDENSKKHTQHNTSKRNNNHSKPKESHGEENSKEIQHLKPKHFKEESDEETNEKSKENHHSKSKKIPEENSSEESEEANHKKCKESTEKSMEKQHQKPKKESKESGEDSEEESESEESKEKYRKISSKETKESKENNKKKTNKGSKESSGEDSGEKSEEVSHGKHKEVHELLKPSNGATVPYKDLIRCIEAAMRRNNGVPAAIRQEHSPLTYIVLNKPC